MTKAERRNPKLLNGSRRRRIASGSGTSVPDVNRLMKQYQDMAGMMKKMKKLGQKGMMRHGLSALMPRQRLSGAEASHDRESRNRSEALEWMRGNPMALKIRLARGGAKKRPFY